MGLAERSFSVWRLLTVAVAIRMKRMGRKNREYYRICATDRRSPRDGRVIEELGTYDPHVAETDARCTLDGARVQHWLSVGAQPSDAVRVLIKKYGPAGTHLKQMEAARARLSMPRIVPDPGEPAFVPTPKAEPVAAAATDSAAAAVSAENTTSAESAPADVPVAEAPAVEASVEAAPEAAEPKAE
jgi:small subunit ribosomal protein S16